jgi:hypothetical protein
LYALACALQALTIDHEAEQRADWPRRTTALAYDVDKTTQCAVALAVTHFLNHNVRLF